MPAKDEEAIADDGLGQGTGSAALKGLTVDTLTPQLARRLGISERISGVVITDVGPGSPAERAGLARGDVIEELDRKPVSSLREFEQVVLGLGDRPVLLLISRNGKTSFMVIEP
jgi:serine protease Do